MYNEVLFKLAIAGLLCLIIGFERELRRKPLGLKTCVVIGISCCLLTVVSIEGAEQFAVAYEKPMDPLRLAAQIVSGIGFLGAGVIMVQGVTIVGLTTAALIWGAAGIGIAVGAGFYIEASLSLLLMMVGVEIMPFIMKKIGPGRLREKELRMLLIVGKDVDVTAIQKTVKSKDIVIQKVRVKDLPSGDRQLEYRISTFEKRYTTEVYEAVRGIEGVVSADVESLT